MKKFLCLLIVLGLCTTTAVAKKDKDDGGGSKFVFYGGIGGNPVGSMLGGVLPTADQNFGSGDLNGIIGTMSFVADLNGLKLGLGFGFGYNGATYEYNSGQQGEATQSSDVSVSAFTIIPSVGYQFHKGITGVGAGLDFYLTSASVSMAQGNATVSFDRTDIGFFPNFQLDADVVKGLTVGLKVGPMITLIGEYDAKPLIGVDKETGRMDFGIRTEIGVTLWL